MYVNVAVLKETQALERRVALVPAVVPKLVKRGARLHMESGISDAIQFGADAYNDVVFLSDKLAMVADADVVLAVQPPAIEVVDAMKSGALQICLVYAAKQPELIKHLLDKKDNLLRHGKDPAHLTR